MLTTARDGAAARFWRYWAAAAISDTGSAVTAVALPLVAVVTLNASATEVGLVTAAGYVAWLLIGLPAGVWVGRLPLRDTQIVMDLVRAAALASLPAAYLLDALTLTHLVVVALVVSLATVVFDVGGTTFLPAVVPREQLNDRNSLMSSTHAVTSLAGPSAGGVLVQLLGPAPTLLVDTASYVVSALLLRGLPPGEPRAAGPVTSMRSQITEGLAFVWRHPVMRPCLLDATATNFVGGGLLTLTPLFLVRTLGASPGVVGLLFATEGAGTLIGAALCPRIARRIGTARTALLGSVAAAGSALLMPLGTGVAGCVLFGLGNAGFAGFGVLTGICFRTHRQIASPPELLARVMATVRFVSWGAIPVGALLAGVLAGAATPRTALEVSCLLALLPAVVLGTSRVRHMHDLLQDDPQTTSTSSGT